MTVNKQADKSPSDVNEDEYDARLDGERSYYVAIEAKRRELQRQIQQAVTAERDRCARIADEIDHNDETGSGIGEMIAARIRNPNDPWGTGKIAAPGEREWDHIK